MSTDVLKFYKTFEERYKEYLLILSRSNSKILPPSRVLSAWSNYLELCLTSRGWNALWYILRKYCDDLQISFPQVVEVQVNDINFRELTASVTISSFDDDDDEQYNLPSKFGSVPLKDLYVTTTQDCSTIDVDVIAECLDQLRIFYHHLWLPWDDDPEYEQFDWVSDHLENRLKLYYDKLLGKVHYVTGKTIKRLMENGQEMYLKLKTVCDKLSVLQDDEFFPHVEIVAEMNEYYDKLESIKSELRLWEIPELRKIEDNNIKKNNSKPGIFLVVQKCEIKNVAKHLLEALRNVTDDSLVKNINSQLEESLLNHSHHDTILLTSGCHELTIREYFDFAVTLKGLQQPKPTIFDKNSQWCFFESLADDILIENLVFKLYFSRSIFFVKRGTICLNSVELTSDKKKSRAIYVYKNAKLIANQCIFSNFKEAIVCMSGSTVQLTDCIFENNDICLKIFKDVQLSIDNCDMLRTVHASIKYENENVSNEGFKNLEYLAKFENVKFNGVKVADEFKSVQIAK